MPSGKRLGISNSAQQKSSKFQFWIENLTRLRGKNIRKIENQAAG